MRKLFSQNKNPDMSEGHIIKVGCFDVSGFFGAYDGCFSSSTYF